MSIFRLLPISLLITLSVATLAAQSSPEKNSVVVQSVQTRQRTFPSTNLFSSNLQTGLKPNAIDHILLGDYRPRLSQFSVPRNWLHNNSDWPSPADGLCLKMRTYKVARDGPHTDATHAAGYSTCQPAVRFQTRSIVLRVPSPTP
ncbi:MAG TPA: hypothetical protein VN901_25080 [Candidatus Acidoferrales bacterium]|nr:hypothetical protein [Candidatus Acidoferrales bacterium]